MPNQHEARQGKRYLRCRRAQPRPTCRLPGRATRPPRTGRWTAAHLHGADRPAAAEPPAHDQARSDPQGHDLNVSRAWPLSESHDSQSGHVMYAGDLTRSPSPRPPRHEHSNMKITDRKREGRPRTADMAPPAAAMRRGGCRSRMAIMPRRQGVPFSTQPGRQTPIKDATMRKIVAGLAISLGGVAESPAGW